MCQPPLFVKNSFEWFGKCDMVLNSPGDPQVFYTSSAAECNMMLLPRRNDNAECCFICGASQAIWMLNSNPTSDNKPFFPFLQYQKPPQNANKLDNNGRCLACNVCHLFLIQQWKSYQENKTPILKRLYWLKRPAEEYHNTIGGKFQNGIMPVPMNKDPGNTSVTQRFTPSSNLQHNGNVYPETSERKHSFQEKELKLLDGNVSSMKNSIENECFLACTLCSYKSQSSSLKYVLTSRQSSADVPFFSKVILGKNSVMELDNPEGRVLVCSTCHSALYQQWLDFENIKVPWNEREYFLEPITDLYSDETILCFLCQETCVCIPVFRLYCKQLTNNDPFYPFLKNLPKKAKAFPVEQEGFTYSCGKCKLFLKNQWDIFEEANVPQEERVYRTHHSQPPLIPSDMDINKAIACFICSSKNDTKCSKRIYCNSGSNMNLGFLKSFPRNKDGYFSEDTGETFVCISCFKELKQHWVKYRSTLFESERVAKYGEQSLLEPKKICKEEKFDCEICQFCVPVSDMLKLSIFPSKKKEDDVDDGQPFFQTLKRLKKSEGELISGCRLCSLNLLNQWSSFETTHSENNSNPYEREYKFNEFVCYICNANVLRQFIGWANIDDVKEGVDIYGGLLAVKYDKSIGVCNDCKHNCMAAEQVCVFFNIVFSRSCLLINLSKFNKFSKHLIFTLLGKGQAILHPKAKYLKCQKLWLVEGPLSIFFA